MQWLENQRPNMFLWTPVAMATGVGLYFALPFEPPLGAGGVLSAALLLWAYLAWQFSGLVRLAILAVLFLNSGYLAAVFRSASVAEPVLTFRYYGPIEGRVIEIDRSKSKAMRLTLDRVQLERVSTPPAKVRVSLLGYIPEGLELGARVALVGSLSPPGGPVEPGGFDFRRYAWFEGLGAVGYSRNPALLMRPYPDPDTGLWLAEKRRALAGRISAAIGGQNGAFAAAILTGDRSRIDDEVLQTLRDSNLAHLLAISGLHMGLLTGFVFLLMRYGLAAIPRLALRLPVKKIGAGAALLAGFGYLFLSGGNVATQRAFVMAAVVLVAVMLDRPAFTLRAVAMAAILVLTMRPESLTQPGFQMSFAATTALVGVFEFLRGASWWLWLKERIPRRLSPLVILLVSSAVAGAATAPIAAYHFNQFSNFGLAANLLTVPLMGALIMPAAVLALISSLVGLGGGAFWLMGKGVGWVLFVADYFSGLEQAVSYIPTGPSVVLPLIAASGCLVFLIQGRGRGLGVAVAVLTVLVWADSRRPLVLVNENAALIGVMTSEGRALNKVSAYKFAAGIWLENDGDASPQSEAFARAGMVTKGKTITVQLPDGWQLVLSQEREVNSQICLSKTILIAPKWEVFPIGACEFIGKQQVRRLSGFLINIEDNIPIITSAVPESPPRPWTNGGKPYR
ncbi:MAG: ComEC family competence protein [Rhodobacteraceae bacterium]|nr:ComEC family competence protein [Paracoccaceae bacterium]